MLTEPTQRISLKPVMPELDRGFFKRHDVHDLVAERARQVDQGMQRLWQESVGQPHGLALLAVGGYGRAELHPWSDIDLLIIGSESALQEQAEALSGFIQSAWDMGLKLSHSVGTLEYCAQLAEEDVSVATSYMEARLLAGEESLFELFRTAMTAPQLWPPLQFFEAKHQEQRQRHARLNDTAYNLEPNIKDGVGGLRDLQTIIWVAKRAYRQFSLRELTAAGFLEDEEAERLMDTRTYLWQVRYALHVLAGRAEERLLFDYQRSLAEVFGFKDSDGEPNSGIEAFMQRHYRYAMGLERLNERVLQAFHEQFSPPVLTEPTIVDHEFCLIDGRISLRDPDHFAEHPLAMLRLFARMQEDATIRGIRAETIRALRANVHRLDDAARNDPEAKRLFIRFFEKPDSARILQRMSRYGLLGAYLPAFEAVTGRMQYDLFHVYTVDQHTLFLLANLDALMSGQGEQSTEGTRAVVRRLSERRCLLLAGLFHDIAKGRGGDHSELGAEDAERFCREHGLPPSDRKLVVWLVRQHLLMSVTAQKRDINDPAVVEHFAREVGHTRYLDHLYLLTIADIRATDPKLWNSWKARLLADLYDLTRTQLRRGIDEPLGWQAQIEDVQREALDRLYGAGLAEERVRQIWAPFPEEYFLRHSVSEIHWQTLAISRVKDDDCLPLVLVRRETERGSTEIFIYTNNQNGLFAAVTGILDNLGLSVVDARIISTLDGHTLDTFQVLDETGHAVDNDHHLQQIRQALTEQLARKQRQQVRISRPLSRRQRHFREPVRIGFSVSRHHERTQLEIYCSDRPGVLSDIGRAFSDCNTRLHDARIATFGDRVEDIFIISSEEDQPLDQAAEQQLADRLRHHLDQTDERKA